MVAIAGTAHAGSPDIASSLVAVSLAVGVGAGALALGVARFVGVTGAVRLTAGAVCVGLLVALGVADVVVPHLGPWWADRPMASAAITGALLTAIIALVVEAVIEHLEARRWRPAGIHALTRLQHAGAAAYANLEEAFATAPASGYPKNWKNWLQSDRDFGPPAEAGLVFACGPVGEFSDIVNAATRTRETIEATATELAPILTATDELNEVYVAALETIHILEALAKRARVYAEWLLDQEIDAGNGPDVKQWTLLAGPERWTRVTELWPAVQEAYAEFQSRSRSWVRRARYSYSISRHRQARRARRAPTLSALARLLADRRR